MVHSFKKSKAVALILAVAVTLSGLFVAPNTAKAADDDNYITILDQSGVATAGSTVKHAFNIPTSTYAAIQIIVPAPVAMAISIDSATPYDDEVTSSPADWDYNENLNYYYYIVDWESPKTGDYNLSLTFGADTEYGVYGLLGKAAPVISNSSIILTKGFSQKLSVSNGTVSSWASSNTKVAAVDKNGKVTGKSTGSATITATTTGGQTLTCSVTVKANSYKNSMMSFNEANYGHAYISITNISYNKKGDLVIKGSYLNNCGYKIVQLRNLKINVKNKSGKLIGTYSASKLKTSILHGARKSFTYTIKKSKLKQKSTQDLRQATVKTSAKYLRTY